MAHEWPRRVEKRDSAPRSLKKEGCKPYPRFCHRSTSESQLREQINEAGERINEQLGPKQIATTLVVLFFAYLEVKENVLTSPFTKEKPARKALNLVDE